MEIGKQIFSVIQEELKNRNIKLTDWLIEKDIILPASIPTFDIDQITLLGHLEKINQKNMKPIYREIFQNIVYVNDGIYDFPFYQNGNKLYNKAGVQLGVVQDMLDNKSIIPKYYKNSDDKICNPYTGDILKEYIIYSGFEIYHSIRPKKYKTFKYDFVLDKLIPTNIIEIKSL